MTALLVFIFVASFYINYEECKSCVSMTFNTQPWQFYINYEECKFIITILNNILNVSFILTMRNVNHVFHFLNYYLPFVLY